MRVDAEHLPEDGLTRLHEVLREAASLADPVRARLGQGGAEGRVVSEGDARRIGGEQVAVVNLAADVALNEAEVFVCWDFHGLKPRVQPGEGVGAALDGQFTKESLDDWDAAELLENLRSRRHLGTFSRVADRAAVLFPVMDEFDEGNEHPPVVHDYNTKLAELQISR